nr:LysR family transcriptional regulator [uncultured Cupriavidus sp.]
MLKDLNLLLVFEAMWQHRSVSIAAEALGVTQAAVSNALRRLREQYKDKLFSAVGRTMEPTPLAVSIAPALLDALAAVRRTLIQPDVFDPGTAHRTFTIRTRDVGEIVCFPSILAGMATEAPHIILRGTFSSHEDTMSGLARGRIDVALGYLPALKTDLHFAPLFRQDHVLVMRRDHPAAHQELSDRVIRSLNFALVEYEGSERLIFERALIDAGARARIKVRLPQFMSAAHIVSQSDLVWIAPETIARAASHNYALTLRPSPYPIEDSPICVYWHDRYHKDPANVWFRNLIQRTCSSPLGARTHSGNPQGWRRV